MKANTQRESVVTYIKSCLIFQIPRFMLVSKYRVISPLSMTILRICVYGFYINKNAELYLLTKSPKCDHIYKLCLHMLEENNC